MALICKDVCRDCLPPQEYFEYGLWMPADSYREETEPPADSDVDSGSEQSVPEGPSAAEMKAAEAKAKEAQSKVSQTFSSVTGGSSTASAAQAGDIVRKCGMAPSMDDVAQLKATKGDNITVKDVEQWIQELGKVQANDTVDNLISFFKYYDQKHSGTLSRRQITNILKSFGEPLTDDEINRLLSDLGMSGDQIDYTKLVEGLLGGGQS